MHCFQNIKAPPKTKIRWLAKDKKWMCNGVVGDTPSQALRTYMFYAQVNRLLGR